MNLVRVLIAVALLMMLLLLRLESERFAAAEYDEPVNRFHRGFLTRLDWYALGLLLLAGIFFIHPRPHDQLFLVAGLRPEVLEFGLALAAVGVVQAAAFAWFRYGGLRFPGAAAYPGAAINAVATAIIDEAAFRGVLLGMLVTLGFPNASAILVETIVYILMTRAAAPGRHPYMLFLAASFGLVGGWVTLETGGIGAAIFVHAVTSFAMFVCTGHAGQVTRAGREPEEVEFMRRAPAGWREAPRTSGVLQRDEMMELFARQGAEPLGMDDQRARVRLAGAAPTSEPRNLELLRPAPPEPITSEPRNLFPPEPEPDVEDDTQADEVGGEPEGAAGGPDEAGEDIEADEAIEVAATSRLTDPAEPATDSTPRRRLSVVPAPDSDVSAPDGGAAAPPNAAAAPADAAEPRAPEAVPTPADRLRAAARGGASAAIARFESIRRRAQSRFGASQAAQRPGSVVKPAKAAPGPAAAAARAAVAAPASGSNRTPQPARPAAPRRSPRPNRHHSSEEATTTPRPTRDRTAGWGTEGPVPRREGPLQPPEGPEPPREAAAPPDPPEPMSTRKHRGR